jgi:hypothetical protein
MGDPQVTMVVSILKWCNDLNDLGPHFRKPPLDDITLTTGWRFFFGQTWVSIHISYKERLGSDYLHKQRIQECPYENCQNMGMHH